MRPSTLARVLLSCAGAALVSPAARAEHARVPAELVALDTPEGEKLLAESTARADFMLLVDSFVTQERPSFCGVASGVMVLNALSVPAPETEVGRQFTQQNFWNDAGRQVYPPESVARGGMTIGQLADILQTSAVKAEVVHGSDISLEDMRARLSKNVGDPKDMVVINYDRGELGQETMGHISPLGAYHAASDRFLVMDVARYKYPPVWAKADAIHRAIRTNDLAAGKSRGFVTVAPTREAPGPEGRAKARSPLVMVISVAAGVFTLGFALGTLFGTVRARRKARASVR